MSMSHTLMYRRTAILLVLAFSTAAAHAADGVASMEGPAVAGVCYLSREAVFANAAAGKDAGVQLQKLVTDAQAEIERDKGRAESELLRLGLRGNITADKLTPEQTKAVQEAQAVQQRAAQRSREIEATRSGVLEQISTAAQPLIAEAYKQHGCGVLIDRGTVLAGNMSHDLTADVVKALDARVKSIPVTLRRETAAAPAPANR
jgi:Skp family chaperone for outer membrane proteins